MATVSYPYPDLQPCSCGCADLWADVDEHQGVESVGCTRRTSKVAGFGYSLIEHWNEATMSNSVGACKIREEKPVKAVPMWVSYDELAGAGS